MKRYKAAAALLILLVLAVTPFSAFAAGEGNIDSGGSGMGGATSENRWSNGNEGVRITVIRAADRAIITTPIDLTNKNPPASLYHFGKVCKLQYNGGRGLTPMKGGYTFVKPAQAVPLIIPSSSGRNNIEAIKSYFTDEQVIRAVCGITGIRFEVLTGGDYRILLEPLAYFKFEGVNVAMTATEAAEYDETLSGGLRRRLVSLTHKNLPLAMFLEISDMGWPAWQGSRTEPVSNADIKSSLGLGIVRFEELPSEPVISAWDYEYRVNTEVITAVMVSGGQSDPDRPARVSFDIAGRSYNVGNVYYPSGDSQLAWVRWRTPPDPQNMRITVRVSGPGRAQGIINVKITDLDKNPPPNPTANDRNDSFSPAPVPGRPQKTSAQWGVWRPWWHEYWVWHGSHDHGHWHDRGWWEFDFDRYSARLTGSMRIDTDSHNPTADRRTMKSGYGIIQNVTSGVSTNGGSAATPAQNAVSYFPEFRYERFWRLLERTGGGSNARFEFKANPYSTYKDRTHFTPVWYPDGAYTVNTWLIDSWTPAGMLSMNLTDSLSIRGNLWMDWHIAPKNPD